MSIHFVFAAFSHKPLSRSHLCAEAKAYDSMAEMSAADWPMTYSVVSSASMTVDTPSRWVGRLFMNSVKRRGPRTEPVGLQMRLQLRQRNCHQWQCTSDDL